MSIAGSGLRVISSYTRSWYLADRLDSLRRTLDTTNAPQSATNYDPWGLPETASGPTFGVTGELQESAAELIYLRGGIRHEDR